VTSKGCSGLESGSRVGADTQITDKIRLPRVIFDPFEPKTVGRMVALGLLAQPMVPLASVPDAHGSGIYAIYYKGDHPLGLPPEKWSVLS
jgi:hypothetical protein